MIKVKIVDLKVLNYLVEVDGVLSGDDVLDGRSGLLFASHFDKFGPDESKSTRFRTNF